MEDQKKKLLEDAKKRVKARRASLGEGGSAAAAVNSSSPEKQSPEKQSQRDKLMAEAQARVKAKQEAAAIQEKASAREAQMQELTESAVADIVALREELKGLAVDRSNAIKLCERNEHTMRDLLRALDEANPELEPSELRNSLPQWNLDTSSGECGGIKSWNLSSCSLKALPVTLTV